MNVYEASMRRIEKIFNDFDNIYVSFSGGKDSGVLMNMVVDYAVKNNQLKKLSIFHIDYEAQYQYTTDYVERVKEKLPSEINFYHICLPIKAQCATSMSQSSWIPWDENDKNIWIRSMPKNSINIDNHNFDYFKKGMWDYDFQNKFAAWLHKKTKAKKTASLIGIRTQESLNRWRAIHSERNYKKYNSLNYSKKMYDNVYNFYPIYDWKTEDIWIANSKFGWDYNKLYDVYHQAGITVDKMRVASPFNDSAQDSLKLYRTIEPTTWARLVSRVNGVNFTGIYGGTTAMGWRSITKPRNHTWKSYAEFLLKTLPSETQESYKTKLATSIKFWRERGGCLSSETIEELKNKNIKISVFDKSSYNTTKLPVRMEYLDEIDIKDFKNIPTYKRLCISILKNDHTCKYMGFSQTKYENEKRLNAISKYKEII